MIVQTVTIPTGAHGVDFADWRPGDEIAADAFVVRYLPTTAGSAWKAVTRAEIDFYHSLGVAVLLVFEQGQADWQQGAAKGQQQGVLAAAGAKALGYPRGLPILFAFDTNAVPGDQRAIAYGEAACDQVEDVGYRFGPYADLDVIKVLVHISVLNWLAGATQWSDPTKPYQPETMPGYELVDVRQTISGSTPNYDNNLVLRPFQAWLPHDEPDVEVEPPTPAIPTTPTEDEPDMPKYYVADSATHGSALVATTFDAAGAPRYTMEGFTDGQTARAWRDAYGHMSYSDADYDALAAGASK